jgi:hypothetical protein
MLDLPIAAASDFPPKKFGLRASAVRAATDPGSLWPVPESPLEPAGAKQR